MTLMWEVRAAPGRIDELVAHVRAHVHASAEVYRSDDADPRVVVIDPTGDGPADVPVELLGRPAHEWHFTRVS
ncbi:MAG: hypothetical protein ABI429_05845 [Jatrophihabitantaceae bacterium]